LPVTFLQDEETMNNKMIQSAKWKFFMVLCLIMMKF
jgi:hypothetical protein